MKKPRNVRCLSLQVESLEERLPLSATLGSDGSECWDSREAPTSLDSVPFNLPAGRPILTPGGLEPVPSYLPTEEQFARRPRIKTPQGLDVPQDPLAPTTQTTIEGINFEQDGNTGGFVFIPPDPSGASGPNHVVSVVNVSLQFHQKNGTKDFSSSLRSFFAGLFPGTANDPVNFTFDPKVIYDQHAGRFVIVTLELRDTSDGDPVNSSRILVAVSDDSNPNGTWYATSINSKINIGGNDTWADYPGFSVDEQAVYITNNMFTFGANSFRGTRLWIIDKGLGGGFYSGAAAAVTVHDPAAVTGFGSTIFTLQPAHVMGTPSSSTFGTVLVNLGSLVFGGTQEAATLIQIDNPLSATPTFTNQFINVGNIDQQVGVPDAPQSGTSIRIDAGDTRALHAVWRNNALHFVNTINPVSGPDAGQATAHWYRVNTGAGIGSYTLADQGNVGGNDIATGAYTFYPSIAVDANDNVAIGFAASAPTIFGSAAYTGRLATDAAGTVQPSVVYAAGLASYVRTFGTPGISRNRWGDYSGISVDPADDATFWVFNEYASTQGTVIGGENGRWGTRWASFGFNQAPTDITLTPSAIAENTDTSAGDVDVGTLSTTDPDPGDSHTYSLVAGTGDTDNGTFVIVGDKLRVKQNTVLDFETKPSYSIRVNTNDGTANFEKVLTVNVTDLIEVESLKIDDGTAQRSVIRTFEVKFDRLLTVAAGAFAVNKRDAGGGAVTVGFTTGVSGDGKTVATLTFSGIFVDASGSLIDGNYDLTIDATKVFAGGQNLDGDLNGSSGGNFLFGTAAADNFYRLFGDADGDGDTDGTDFSTYFLPAFGSVSGDAAYRAYFDSDLDGDVDGTDFAVAFLPNFGMMRDTSGY